jgi:hypothetical protein
MLPGATVGAAGAAVGACRAAPVDTIVNSRPNDRSTPVFMTG